jgi:hypothetical protein
MADKCLVKDLDKNEDCCICLEKTKFKINSCQHFLCINCFQELHKRHHPFIKCPLCRKLISEKIINGKKFSYINQNASIILNFYEVIERECSSYH